MHQKTNAKAGAPGTYYVNQYNQISFIGPVPGRRPTQADYAIAGSVWVQVSPGVGVSVPFAWIPQTDRVCLGVGPGVGGPSSGLLVGPVLGSGDPEQVLSGWSVSVSGANGVGGQWIHNKSGIMAGPAVGTKGFALSVTYSWCTDAASFE